LGGGVVVVAAIVAVIPVVLVVVVVVVVVVVDVSNKLGSGVVAVVHSPVGNIHLHKLLPSLVEILLDCITHVNPLGEYKNWRFNSLKYGEKN